MIGANNEIGTVQNIKAIANTAHEKGIIFHVDAVQLFPHMNIDVAELGIDAMSISAHKLFGPKGIGALYVKDSVLIDNLMYGGQQERAKRPGTMNVPAIVGFGKAVEICKRDLNTNEFKIKKLREYFKSKLKDEIPDIMFNGSQTQTISSVLNVSFVGAEGESVMTMLDMKGICVSVGAACSSNGTDISHVIKALGYDNELAQSAVRFSISKLNSFEEIDTVVEELKEIVKKLRAISPIYKKGCVCTTKK